MNDPRDAELIVALVNNAAALLAAARLGLAAQAAKPDGTGWVACSERMPEEYVIVLVVGGLAAWQGGTRWDSMMPHCTGRTIQWPVTHWMPLPTSPNEAAFAARNGAT